MLEQARLFLWFLRRPALHGGLNIFVQRKLNPADNRRDQTRDEALGWSSLALLLSLGQRSGVLVSTDLPYPERNNVPCVGCVVPEALRPRWSILSQADRESLPKALEMWPRIDFCHYDSGKSYHGRLWDALRPGGLFISDDICDNIGSRDFADIVGCREPLVVEC